MAGTSPLAGLLDRARTVYSLAWELGRTFREERGTGGGVRQVDPTRWGRHQPVFDEFCAALLDLRDAMQNPPEGFAPVAQALLKAAGVAKQIRDEMKTAEGQRWAAFLDRFPDLNSAAAAVGDAIKAATEAQRLDDPFAFVDQPAAATTQTARETPHVVPAQLSDRGHITAIIDATRSALQLARNYCELEKHEATDEEVVYPPYGVGDEIIKHALTNRPLSVGLFLELRERLLELRQRMTQAGCFEPDGVLRFASVDVKICVTLRKLAIDMLSDLVAAVDAKNLDADVQELVDLLASRLEGLDETHPTSPSETPATEAQEPAQPLSEEKPRRRKRSTERGEGRAKLIAALTKYHQYAEGGCLILEPIGNNELAKAAGVCKPRIAASDPLEQRSWFRLIHLPPSPCVPVKRRRPWAFQHAICGN
jgi:hypothetical protein